MEKIGISALKPETLSEKAEKTISAANNSDGT